MDPGGDKPSSSASSSILAVPECARGMTVFDAEKFRYDPVLMPDN